MIQSLCNACDARQRVDFWKKPFVRFSIVLDDHSTSRDFVSRSVASGPIKLVPLAWKLVRSTCGESNQILVTGDQQCWYKGSI